MIKNRRQFVKQILKDCKMGVEVGSFEGSFARYILETIDIEMLYLIEPFAMRWADKNEEKWMKCLKNIEPHQDRASLIEGYSVPMSECFEDGELDFVYIDADHSYECTKEDIEAWYPKVKKGGIVSGHDYKNNGNARSKAMLGTRRLGVCGVKRAVDEFTHKLGVSLRTTHKEPRNWWFIK